MAPECANTTTRPRSPSPRRRPRAGANAGAASRSATRRRSPPGVPRRPGTLEGASKASCGTTSSAFTRAASNWATTSSAGRGRPPGRHGASADAVTTAVHVLQPWRNRTRLTGPSAAKVGGTRTSTSGWCGFGAVAGRCRVLVVAATGPPGAARATAPVAKATTSAPSAIRVRARRIPLLYLLTRLTRRWPWGPPCATVDPEEHSTWSSEAPAAIA